MQYIVQCSKSEVVILIMGSHFAAILHHFNTALFHTGKPIHMLFKVYICFLKH